mmetsp:Transcript_21162/g.80850  ORF Transcript_21162/g.80850 Transcript_21162/m.80850 type:complete len:256 (+) Transcript_21162:1489-2256(+)
MASLASYSSSPWLGPAGAACSPFFFIERRKSASETLLPSPRRRSNATAVCPILGGIRRPPFPNGFCLQVGTLGLSLPTCHQTWPVWAMRFPFRGGWSQKLRSYEFTTASKASAFASVSFLSSTFIMPLAVSLSTSASLLEISVLLPTPRRRTHASPVTPRSPEKPLLSLSTHPPPIISALRPPSTATMAWPYSGGKAARPVSSSGQKQVHAPRGALAPGGGAGPAPEMASRVGGAPGGGGGAAPPGKPMGGGTSG